MDEEIVRTAMLLRANSLSRGYSGIRPELVEAILALLNAGITPLVPEYGSVGASGDLAPLSHIGLALLGRGEVFVGGERLPAGEALAGAGLAPLRLEMKEGLALNNGVQVMNALGLLACDRLKTLLKTAAVTSALTAQVMLAPDTYYRPDFHLVRPHPGALKVADWIWRIMQDSPIRMAHRDFKDDGQVQDPYNIRCAAQILGAAHDLISQAERTLIIEANSATDNPILLPDQSGQYIDVVSGGHFHGMPVAVQVYNLMQALGVIAGLAHQRSVRYVDPTRNKGLGRDLKWPGLSKDEKSVSSGMMMLEYASACPRQRHLGRGDAQSPVHHLHQFRPGRPCQHGHRPGRAPAEDPAQGRPGAGHRAGLYPAGHSRSQGTHGHSYRGGTAGLG